MKFLCPSCKAKYQIADEKVIGRSVKMKCRQCGHIIEIQQSVVGASTGTSQAPIPLTSIPAPPSGPPKPTSEGMAIRPPVTAGGRLTAKAPTKPARPAGAELPAVNRNLKLPGSGGGRSDSPVRLAPLASRSAPSAGASHSPPQAPARIGTASGPPSERPVPRPPMARTPSLATPAPPAARAPIRNLGIGKSIHTSAETHNEARSAPLGRPTRTTPETAPAPTVAGIAKQATVAAVAPRRTGEALAEAFTAAVGVAATLSADQFVGDEWYVGINDTPVGPIPLSELRARAAQGQVTIESLVWRDGFEDWKPVRSFPELLAVVEEAISSIQASRGPISPAFAPADYGPAIALLPVPEHQPLSAVSAREAAKQPTQKLHRNLSQSLPRRSRPKRIAAVTGRGIRRSPKGAWIAVAGALALGLAIGFVFFRQVPATPEIKYVEVAPSGSVAAVTSPNPSVALQDTPVVTSAGETRTSAKRIASGDSKASPETNGTPITSAGLKGLSGLRALGPQSGPAETGSSSGSSSGQALDSATLQKTVSRYTASVRRSCWQPALDSRAPDAPTVARVAVKINIAPSGNVSGVSSNGDPRGYRGLANCIESRVRNWSFPPSSGATTVNVPFVFAAQ